MAMEALAAKVLLETMDEDVGAERPIREADERACERPRPRSVIRSNRGDVRVKGEPVQKKETDGNASLDEREEG